MWTCVASLPWLRLAFGTWVSFVIHFRLVRGPTALPCRRFTHSRSFLRSQNSKKQRIRATLLVLAKSVWSLAKSVVDQLGNVHLNLANVVQFNVGNQVAVSVLSAISGHSGKPFPYPSVIKG
jgi:hypothetical protein